MMAQRTVVIVVDDDAGLLKSVARLLAHHGIDSRTFASAEALLESDSVQTATCLLLDIHLGGISGIELQRRLAASGSKWPVIFMTANDDEATRNEAMDAGCIAYLRKPFAQACLAECHFESCGLAGAAITRTHGIRGSRQFPAHSARGWLGLVRRRFKCLRDQLRRVTLSGTRTAPSTS